MINYYIKNYYGYYILFFLLLILSLCKTLKPNKEDKFYKIFAVISSLFIIFRFDVEFDYVWYWIVGDNRFKDYWFYDYGFNASERFFKFLYLIVRFFDSPKLFFIITGFIFSIIFFTKVKKYSKNIFLALSFYFYLNTIYITFLIGFIRQGIAIIFSVFIIEKLLKKEYKRFVLLTFLNAIFVHKSALICLMLLPIKIFESKKNFIKCYYGIIITLAIKMEWIVKNIEFLKKYTYFFKKQETFNDLGIKVISILFLLFIGILLLKINFKIKLNQEEIFFYNIVLMGFLFYFISYKLVGGHVPLRISLYFLFYFPIYFSNYFLKIKHSNILSLYLIVLLFIFGNYRTFKYSLRERENSEERVSKQFKLMFFKDYKNLNGKYIPMNKKVDYEIRDK